MIFRTSSHLNLVQKPDDTTHSAPNCYDRLGRQSTMPPRKSSTPQPTSPSHQKTSSTSSIPAAKPQSSKPAPSSKIRNTQDAQEIVLGVWNNYVDQTPQRVKLLDAFMAFLIVVGVLQFVYCVIAGNYVCINTPARRVLWRK